MDLDIAIENCTFRLKTAMQSIASKDESCMKGHSYVLACQEHRNLAALKIQLYADKAQFTEHLRASVAIWLKFCQSIAAGQQYQAESFCGTRFYPLFDALALGDVNKATEIANFYPDQWHPDWEYEEDYLYYKFICQYLLRLKQRNTSDLDELLQRWKVVVENNTGNDFSVCTGLLNSDRDEFMSGLLGLIEEREQKFEDWRETASYIPEVEYCNRYVYVNGLGLLSLASLSNMRINETILTLPDIAIVSPSI